MTRTGFQLLPLTMGLVTVFFGTWMLLSPKWWQVNAMRAFTRQKGDDEVAQHQQTRVMVAGGLLIALGLWFVVAATLGLLAG